MDDADVLRGVLAAYKTVMEASWPHLHPAMKSQSQAWATASAGQLNAELQEDLRASADQNVRVFWRLGTPCKCAGVTLFSAPAGGFPTPPARVGAEDFDRRLPWTPQAAK